MKNKVVIILICISLVSCVNDINCLLPKEYDLVKIQEVVSFPDKLTVYEVSSNRIDYTEIQNYPNCSKAENYHYQKWIGIEELDERDKTHITLVIQGFSERVKKEDKNFYDLENILNNEKNLSFSGVFIKTKSAGNKTYNFYDRFNILDRNKNRLYQIEYIKDY
ncbi:hypothetical protein NMK71_01425 [Weeksellaceae bacterium KMM 9713]|uniref:Lipoprotein n=1 Tax=Profundicola chukchiensis TaxID=2961959 RepID=A0A9X4MVY7_9FLAO|nr:hypothetical protein [Profundicola chukchiensis]MDG4945063.1 hypothetical protein [Profundicola chukchiensis]MDG4950147.1 hypothetical protein [Profundicola chukchiensis]